MTAALITIIGRVQGVGFRWWVSKLAREHGLSGYAHNKPNGQVEVLVQGESQAVGRMIELLTQNPPPASRPGRVEGDQVRWVEPDPRVEGFSYA